MSKPFKDIRVLDFTQVFAGPFGSLQLSLLGADVIKVERKEGEDSRYGPLSKEWADKGLSPSWQAINVNKRNIALDLKNPMAIEIIKRLVKHADVAMENFRPGVMDRLGIGYEALSAINPQLIYCAVTGFGQEGPERNTPSYDGKIQAVSGIMSITGHPSEGPTRAGFAVCDAVGGLTAAFAVASALFQRTHTGRGQFIDVAMFDAALTVLSPNVGEYTVAGHVQEQYGNQAISRRPTANRFLVKDGFILLAVNTEAQFQNLMKGIGREDVFDDPRFVDWRARIENEPALRKIIEDVFLAHDAEYWEAHLEKAGAPAARIRTIADAVAHPQLAHRDVLQTVPSEHGELKLVGSGFKMAHGGGSIDRPPARLGQHTEEILHEAGFDGGEISEFRASGVI